MGTIIGDYIGTTIGSIHPFPTKNQGEGVGCAHGHRFLASVLTRPAALRGHAEMKKLAFSSCLILLHLRRHFVNLTGLFTFNRILTYQTLLFERVLP